MPAFRRAVAGEFLRDRPPPAKFTGQEFDEETSLYYSGRATTTPQSGGSSARTPSSVHHGCAAPEPLQLRPDDPIVYATRRSLPRLHR